MNIQWDSKKCCHSGVCVKTLPEVFKIQEGQFVIESDRASDKEILEVVKQCPSGALTVT
jgi:uncharacterized Fe-S cluster protein YjdI